MDITHEEERTSEALQEMSDAEKQFLKDLYGFMKRKNTPIQRIPNLGFKQIDLFVMFKAVGDLGGYHQVTSQQLWKQVYNTLGGNPRSTSAATCTRRHYEKLLLPYECHVKGIPLIVPQHQPKSYQYMNLGKEDDDSPILAKRKLTSLPRYQSLQSHQSDRYGSTFLLQTQYPQFNQPNPDVLPPHASISSTVSTLQSPPNHQFSFNPYHLHQTQMVQEPLEHLRSLAERYKTSPYGLAEPLNLSVKAPRQETNFNPASSFAPPSSNKSVRFLNKPFPLYTPQFPQGHNSEKCETQEGDAVLRDIPHSYPEKTSETYFVDVKAHTVASSPTIDSALGLTDEGATKMVQKPSCPKTDFTMQSKESNLAAPDERGLELSRILPSLPRENEKGEMEIEIPLSVFHNWLKLCKSTGMMHGNKKHPTCPTTEEHSEQSNCSYTDTQPNNLSFRTNSQPWSSVNGDQRLRQDSIQTSGGHHNVSQNSISGQKPLPSGGILKNAVSRDVFGFHQQDLNKPYCSNARNYCDMHDQDRPIQLKAASPSRVLQNFATSRSCNEEAFQIAKEKPELCSSVAAMMNPNSSSVLQLTPEEVMKLKKIISSSW